MLVINSFEDVPEDLTGSVMTLGNFDGIHRGHSALIQTVIDCARKHDAYSVLLTFRPHPIKVLHPEIGLPAIHDFRETVSRLEKRDLDILLALPFTRELAAMQPLDFLDRYIRKYLHPRVIVLGYNHRFGAGRSGDITTLERYGRQHGITVIVVGPVIVDGVPVSSTRIREAVMRGDLHAAAAMLGEPFHLSGTVVRGEGRGAPMGFPTANLEITDRVLPPPGVYATRTRIQDDSIDSVTYIGHSPTFRGEKIRVETYLLDWTGDLYDRDIMVVFLDKIRGERTFSGVSDLVKRMKTDIRRAKRIHSDSGNENQNGKYREESRK